MKTMVTLTSEDLPKVTHVMYVRGQEAISQAFEYEVVFRCAVDEEVDFARAVSFEASLKFERHTADGKTTEMWLCGAIAALELIVEDGDWTIYRLVLTPRMAGLQPTRHSHARTEVSVRDLIEEMMPRVVSLKDDVELRLSDDYATEELIIQYKESHWDFLSRWLEREGIYYFFEHSETGDAAVFCDSIAGHSERDGGPIPFQAGEGPFAVKFTSFTMRQKVVPQRVRISDYDYQRPGLRIDEQLKVDEDMLGEFHVQDGRFFTPDAGKRLLKLRQEEFVTQKVQYFGTTDAMGVRAGTIFELDQHRRDSINGRYLTTEMRLFVNQTEVGARLRKVIGLTEDDTETYRVEVTAIKADVQYRPPRITPWPRIWGYENGTVDGPDPRSDYAQIDEHGRYKVRFSFDEFLNENTKSSTWVRMMQPHGGEIEGFHFPLRYKTEVVLAFMGGDPDRPVIAGVVPNAEKPSPVTSKNNRTNIIQTGGNNLIQLDDERDSERITVRTPKENTMLRLGAPNDNHNAILTTDGNTLHHTGGQMDQCVVGPTSDERKSLVEEWFYAGHDKYIQGHREVDITGPDTLKVSTHYEFSCSSAEYDTQGHTLRKTGTLEEKAGNVTIDWGATIANMKSYQVTAGTYDITAGGTTIDLGYTKGSVAAISVAVPGTCDIKAPNWNLTGGSTKWFEGVSAKVFGVKLEAAGLTARRYGLKREINSVALGFNHVKMEASVLELKNAPIKVNEFAAEISKNGIISTLAGLVSIK